MPGSLEEASASAGKASSGQSLLLAGTNSRNGREYPGLPGRGDHALMGLHVGPAGGRAIPPYPGSHTALGQPFSASLGERGVNPSSQCVLSSRSLEWGERPNPPHAGVDAESCLWALEVRLLGPSVHVPVWTHTSVHVCTDLGRDYGVHRGNHVTWRLSRWPSVGMVNMVLQQAAVRASAHAVAGSTDWAGTLWGGGGEVGVKTGRMPRPCTPDFLAHAGFHAAQPGPIHCRVLLLRRLLGKTV